MRKKSIGELGLVLLCAGLLLTVTASAQTDRSATETAIGQAQPAQLSRASSAQATVNEKEASLPEVKPSEGLSEEQLKLMEEFQGKEPPALEESAFSVLPAEVGYDEDFRGPCLGDKDINGAGTLSFTYMLNTGWHDRRTTSIYLASEFGCDGGPINGIRYYVSTVPGMAFTNLTIRLKHTTATVYVTPYCMSNTGWTVGYQANTTISTTGWYTFTFATPFAYNGVDNLEVDVCFNNTAYTGGGAIYAFSAGTGVYRTMYAYTDSGYGDPLVWTCGTGNPSIYGLINVPRAQFIFPPPNLGACCVNFACVATNTSAECAALGGTWYGGQDCATFICPPWNDNCSAVTPVALTPGTPVTFTGNNLGATNDCGSFAGGQVWHAITLPGVDSFFDVWLDYCTTNNGGFPFGNAWLNWATGCPCTGITTAGTFETTTCGDGNITIKWSGLASGTFYYPVLLDVANHAAGDYTLHVVCMPSYCSSNATSTADETLKTVQLGTINNTTLDCDKYNDFTYLSTDVIAGATYPFNIVIGDCEGASCYSKRLAIFIDLNQDFDFTDTGERVYNSGQLTNAPCPDFPLAGTITIPATATVGCTRMRVVVVETSSADPSSCGTYTWGATEDYTVCILPPGEQGACCFGTSCTPEMYQFDCEQQGGRYKGDGTTCTPLNPCFGACCFMDGSCLETLDLAECAGLGGTYSGDGTTCTPNLCPQPGNNCANPMPIVLSPGSLPLVDADTTCGRVNDYADTCLGSYDGGEDIIYAVLVTDPMCVSIAVDGVLTWVGVAIDTACPPGLTCLAYNTNSGGNPVIASVNLNPGVYYIMIDTYPAPTCTDFTMTISACPTPGACCFADGSCQMLLPAACATAGGVPQGEGTDCDPNPCEVTYCTAGSSYLNCDEYISRVQVGTIDNATACSQPGGYGNYLYLSTDLMYAVGAPITVTNGNPYSSDQCMVWIDWNQDKDFYDPGEAITMSGSPGNGPYSATIVAPAEALTGPTRMRVRITYIGLVDPCGITTYGEVEDYTVNIIEVAGACCWGDGTCTNVLPSECGGFFAGPFTECSLADCNGNSVDDFCDIASGYSTDCDSNGVPDECQPWADCNANGIQDFCDIADGTSQDCNENGIPDECDVDPTDPDGNGLVSADCQPDGIPDECQLGGGGLSLQIDDGTSENNWGLTAGGEMCWINHFTGTGNVSAISATFGSPAFPGSAGVTPGQPFRVYVWGDSDGNGVPSGADFLGETTGYVDAGSIDTDVVQPVTLATPIAVSGSFFIGCSVNSPAGGYPGTADDDGQTQVDQGFLAFNVIPFDPTDLTTSLYPMTALGYPMTVFILRVGSGGGGGGDCNGNGIPDFCDVPPPMGNCVGPDCSQDCQPNGVPDECEPDCNGNDRPDDCDIAAGTSQDCNGNAIPDECDIADGTSQDCQPNGVPDECDIASGASQDCQPNGIPDECDIAAGACDCQGDGIPDGCQLQQRAVLYDNGPLATGPGCTGEVSLLQDTLGLTIYGFGAQQSAGNRVADDFALSTACHIDTITVYTYQTGSTPPTITSVVMQIWDGPPNAGGTVIWGDLTTNRLVSCTAASIFRTLPTIDCTRHIQTCVCAVDVQLAPGTYWVDYSFAGSGASGPWAPPVTLLGQTGSPGANALQWLASSSAWGAALDVTYPQDFPFLVEGTCGAPPNDCNQNGIPDECDIGVQWDGYCAGPAPCFPDACVSDWDHNGVPDTCEICGDLDNDGDVDLDDYWVFLDAFGTCVGHPKYNPAADLDGDDCVTLVDYCAWRMCYKMATGKDFVAPKPKPMPKPAKKAVLK